MLHLNECTNRKDDIFMQRRLYIDEAHTALDIFRFAVFFKSGNASSTFDSWCVICGVCAVWCPVNGCDALISLSIEIVTAKKRFCYIKYLISNTCYLLLAICYLPYM